MEDSIGSILAKKKKHLVFSQCSDWKGNQGGKEDKDGTRLTRLKGIGKDRQRSDAGEVHLKAGHRGPRAKRAGRGWREGLGSRMGK